nr:hypothetical protein [uncultured Rhodopila sp.]
MTSPDNTVIGTPNESIVDTGGNTWTIVGGRVAVNGVVDPSTANVIEMAYESGVIWQKNADDLWWSKSSPAAAWKPPYGTPVDPIPNQHASANDTIVTVIPGQPASSITDASGNTWSILNGQVSLNGVADGTTANVIELAWANGRLWQENANHIWWSKAKPSDPWAPANGTPVNPVSGVVRTWTGDGSFDTASSWMPGGVPQNGDTAVVPSGSLQITPGNATGVNFVFAGGGAGFNVSGNYYTGLWYSNGTTANIGVGYPGQTVNVVTNGIDLTHAQMIVAEIIYGTESLAIHGTSNIRAGSTLAVQDVGTASLPRGALENDGRMNLDASTLAVGSVIGHGVVRATGNSIISTLFAGSSETIQLVAGHLDIGGSPIGTSTAMQFLAPITEFGRTSEISLNDTHATSEVFAKSGPTAGELFLYDGSALVADLHISGQAHIYAQQTPVAGSGDSVVLTAYDSGHSLPVVTTGA